MTVPESTITRLNDLVEVDPKLTVKRLTVLLSIEKRKTVYANVIQKYCKFSSVKYARSVLDDCIKSGYVEKIEPKDSNHYVEYKLSSKGKKVVKLFTKAIK